MWNDIDADQDDWAITLPDATLGSSGADIILNNISIYLIDILDNDGNILYTLDPGDVIDFKLVDTTTTAGVWRNFPFGGGYSAVVSFDVESSDNSIIVTNGSITTPGGVIDITLPESISNIEAINSVGLAVITNTSPLEWVTAEILAGTNITVTDGDGVLGNPVINVNNDLIGLNSIEVGNFSFSGPTLSALGSNTDIYFSSNGIGLLNLNGITIDVSENIVSTGTLTIPQIFVDDIIGSNVPKAWCVFTDISNVIVIEDQVNVSSIVKITDSSGSYEIYFTNPMININYGVQISLGTSGGSTPFVTHGFWTTRSLNSVVITVVDASGQLVSELPYGVTISIMQRN